MKSTLAALAAAAALSAAPSAAAEEISVALPGTLELAEVQPGLQVVTRLDLEVFYLNGAYWLRSSGRWYAARRPGPVFQAAEARSVPPALAGLEPGRYLDYRPTAGQRVVQRHLGAEAEPVGGRVDAGTATVAPRGTLMAPDTKAKAKTRPAPAAKKPPAKAKPARPARPAPKA